MPNMNTEELNAIWQIMLKTIRADKLLSEAAAELWFKHFRLDYLDANRAVFAAENEMKANIIKEKYGAMLASQIEKVIGYEPSIDVAVDPSLAPQLKRPMNEDGTTPRTTWQDVVRQFGGNPDDFGKKPYRAADTTNPGQAGGSSRRAVRPRRRIRRAVGRRRSGCRNQNGERRQKPHRLPRRHLPF